MIFINHVSAVEARLVGNTVVASFRHSNPSLIWKYDLEKNHSFTLALQGEEGDFELGVTSPKGDFSPVARFATKEDADEAFLAVQKVLMQGRWSKLRTVMTGIAGVFAMFLLYSFLGHFLWTPAAPTAASALIGLPPSTKPLTGQINGNEQGVPLPADQMLVPPK